MTDVAKAFDAIRVPVTWAGFTRTVDGKEVWACGACPDVRACMATGECQRATDQDFEYAKGHGGD